MKKILIGSPVRQKHLILEQFLKGLEEMDKENFQVSYYFVDDNVDAQSSDLLKAFAEKHDALVVPGKELTSLDAFSGYVSTDVKHIWDASSIRKVAYFKDSIIEHAVDRNFDYLFFVDSDIVVDRRTLKHLISRNVEIVSNIFWTQWQPNWQLEPQCFWMPALNRRSRAPFDPPIDPEEARQMQRDFFAQMRVPGIYRVDGLGACTLIACSALRKGARFREIPNLALLGEDRHFCVRAGALDIDLYFDTVHPVYHIYRDAYLDRVEEFKRDGFRYDMCQTYQTEPASAGPRENEIARVIKKAFSYLHRKTVARIQAKRNPPPVFVRKDQDNTLGVILTVDDGSLQYLNRSLESIAGIADYIVIADGTTNGVAAASTDMPCTVLRIGKATKTAVYSELWQQLAQNRPDWVLALSADEVFSPQAAEAIPYLLANVSVDSYRFKCVTGENGETYKSYLMRYQSEYRFHWCEETSAGIPREADSLRYANINLNVFQQP